MALIPNPNFNPSDPNSQRFIFSDSSEVINPQTGQTAQQAQTGQPITKIDVPVLTPATPINYVNPNASFFSAPPPIVAPQTLSPEETDIQKRLKEIAAGQESMIGKTAFTQEQAQTFGLPEIHKTQNDLTSQLLALQAEEKNIPLQIQREFAGRGVTASGVAPIETGRLRENAIQANIVSAQLAAVQGKLGTAQYNINRAVEAKYGPIEEANKVKLANLELLLKDPGITLAEKNRGNAQALALRQKEAEIAKARQETNDIWNTSVIASQNVANFKPTDKYPTAAVAVQAIQNAKTKEIAQQIQLETGLTKPPTAQSDFEQAFFREHGTLPSVQQLLEFKQKEAAAGRKPGKPEKDIFREAQNTLQQYKDRGYSRSEVENEWKKQNATSGQDYAQVELPLTVQKALDNIYGPVSKSPPAEKFKWYNPFTWFQ